MTTTAPEGETLVGIARLIAQYRERTGSTYADLAAATGLTRGYFGYLLNTPPPHYVKPSTLQRISDGTGIPLLELFAAAAQSAGYADTSPPLPSRVAMLAEQIARLDSRSLLIVESMVSTMRSDLRE